MYMYGGYTHIWCVYINMMNIYMLIALRCIHAVLRTYIVVVCRPHCCGEWMALNRQSNMIRPNQLSHFIYNNSKYQQCVSLYIGQYVACRAP